MTGNILQDVYRMQELMHLNSMFIFCLPILKKAEMKMKRYILILFRKSEKFITIPFSLKIGYYFSSLAQTALKLSETGIAGLTLFNRPYNPDIDIDTSSGKCIKYVQQ